MSVGVKTLGTTLSRNGVRIAQIQDVTGPQLSKDADDITNHDSPGGVEEFLTTIKRTGEITMPVVFNGDDPTHDDHTGLIAAWEDDLLEPYSMRYPDGSGWDFNAYVMGVSMTAPVGGHLAADLTLRPSGKPEFFRPGS